MADTTTETSETSEPPEPSGVAVTIDGREIIAEEGELVIAAAERNGIYIPRFCYHPRMSSVGMCRMCIVEIDTGRGPSLQPSCMLECTPGMVVDTESAVTKKAQEGVLEFLLINHPLDCPVCDKGGECPLQDQTMSNGPGESRLVEEKRHFEKPIPISDLILLDRERCILCDRCTRFAKEVAGDPGIHFLEKSNQTQINIFPDEPFSSYFSGNTVQICPVGALTAPSYRFKARPWDLQQSESTCQSCAVGCRVAVQSSRDEVLRYLGVDIDPVNWGWLCDKGRFNIEVVHHQDRLVEPLVRTGDTLKPIRWSDALVQAGSAIRASLEAGGPSQVGIVGGSRLTNEDAYAWAKLAKGVIGTDNVDAQLGDGLPAEVVMGLPQATIDQVCRPGGTVILLGPDLEEELPILFLRLRHAVENDGVTVVEVTPVAGGCTPLAAVSLLYRPGEAAEVAKVLVGVTSHDGEVAGVPADLLGQARGLIEGAESSVSVVLGRQSLAEGPGSVVDAAGVLVTGLPDVRFLLAVRRANTRGALDLGLAPGILPGRVSLDEGSDWFAAEWPSVSAERGLDTLGMLEAAADGRLDTLVLLGADPLADFPDRDLAERALKGVRTLIACDLFLTESSRLAHIVLPAAGFTEVEGTATNLEGRVSTLHQRVTPPGSARADWLIASELARELGADLGLESPAQIWDEIERLAPSHAGLTTELLSDAASRDGVVVPIPAAPVSSGEENEDQGDEVDGSETAGGDEGDSEAETDGDGVDERPVGPSRPALLSWVPVAPAAPPALDSYSLRLVSGRKLYDQGTMVSKSPSLVAPGTTLRVNAYDFDRLGVSTGSPVRISTGRGAVTLPIEIDARVPRGSANLYFNQPPVSASSLIDASLRVTEVRVESSGQDAT